MANCVPGAAAPSSPLRPQHRLSAHLTCLPFPPPTSTPSSGSPLWEGAWPAQSHLGGWGGGVGTPCFRSFSFKRGSGFPPPQQPWTRWFDIACSLISPLKWKLQKLNMSNACYYLPRTTPLAL